MEHTKKNTNLTFIKKSVNKHGDKYDYSLVRYKNVKEKVKIICKDHGIFEQSPRTHLEGSGCPKCGGKKKLTIEDFIKISNEVHSSKFDYSLVEYKNNRTKVKIICKDHGIFEQIPFTHMSGTNCPKCSKTSSVNKSDFINNGDNENYDYSLIENIKNNKEKVKIICKKHGIFEQSYNNHINGKCGCPECYGKMKYDKKSFIEKSINIHGDKYDYSLVNYVNNKTKVKIICPIHGEFEQEPASHINAKCGCRRCKISKGELRIINFLKIKNIKHDHLYIVDKMEFDFFLPDYNIFIEYDGEQHFKPIEFFGGEISYKKQKLNDDKKNYYCFINKYNLLRIAYYDYDNIETILNQKVSIK